MKLGGEHTISGTAKRLDDSSVPCRLITIRLDVGASPCYFGNADADVGGQRHGYLTATETEGESWTFGPYQNGGLRPQELYIFGTAGDILFWDGTPA